MAAKFLGETIISGAIQVLLDRIASPQVVNFFLGKKDSDLRGLSESLECIVRSLATELDVAEQKQLRNDPRVEAWLDKVQDALFDADDLLDEIETDALQLKVEGESSAGTSEVRESKKQKISDLFYRSGNSNDGVMEGRVKEFIKRLEGLKKQMDILGVKKMISETKPWQRLPSTSLVEESVVFGRDDDKEVVIKFLLSNDVCREKIGVIPIVGMGGVGKTTLAQAVFNHNKVKENFQLKAWVCVSEEYDALRVTKTILKSVSESSCDDAMDLNSVQVKLRERLAGKKFLIVLDDVWNGNYLDWDILRMPFIDGAQGSKIIVSTRDKKVANIMGTVPSRELKELSEDACWQLFSRHASGIGDFTTNPELVRIGRDIVGKCKGLPLAVKTLGGLLRSTLDVQEWERVSRSDIWESSEVVPALRLSYSYLPSPLKQCFAYCSIFPKDYEFDKEELILLWMAENLLQGPNTNKRMEDVGDEYFNDLVSRSFLQLRYTEYKSFFVMHDLLVDLARFVSKRHCFLLEKTGSSNEVKMMQTRYFAYVSETHDNRERFSSICGANHLRTFLAFNVRPSSIFSKDAADDLFLKLKYLRVLSLSGYENVRQLPNSFCDLRHLRYLNLSSTLITCLPKSTSTLYNLQTLQLANCHSLYKLPKNFHQLVNLRYLDVSNTKLKELPESLSFLSKLQALKLKSCYFLTRLPNDFHCLINLRYLDIEDSGLKEMPTQISKLTCLQTLSTFVVGKDTGACIRELGGLSELRGKLHIRNLQYVVELNDVLEAKLREKKHLKELKLQWAHHGTNGSVQERDVLDNLMPNPCLKTLVIANYGGKEFPSWLGHQSFCNIVDFHLSSCNHCVTLPPLGQLASLRKLRIEGFHAVVNVGPEFYGNSSSMVKPFSSLEELDFNMMPIWKEWSLPDTDVEAFPKLRRLSLQYCSSLTGDLPRFLPSLMELTISECQQLASSLPKMPNVIELKLDETSDNIIRAATEALESSSYLQNLEIITHSLSSVQFIRCLPTTLKKLNISSHMSFEFQLQQQYHNSLEHLSIACREGFFGSSLALDSFPNITSLSVEGCRNPESLWVLSNGLSCEALKSLSWLHISNTPNLTLFPIDGLSFPNLTNLTVQNCKELKFLHEQMHSLPPSLEYLQLENCLELESFPISGLPSSLRWLKIRDCDKLVASRRNWNLQRLPNLTNFWIWGCGCEDMESFPEEGLLPSTIIFLDIWDIKCLKRLDNKGLQQLTSLKKLYIYNCPQLQTMPEEGFPASLVSLSIDSCHLVEKKCKRETGEYWNKIAHIPCIYIS